MGHNSVTMNSTLEKVARPAPAREVELPGRRVEAIVSETPGGRRQVVVQDLSYGPGVGWYVQKSIRLDAEQVEALLGALCCARQDCRRLPSVGSTPNAAGSAPSTAPSNSAPSTAPSKTMGVGTPSRALRSQIIQLSRFQSPPHFGEKP